MHAPLRELGDSAFRQGRYLDAVKLYRESIATAEDGLVYSMLHLADACMTDGGAHYADEIRNSLIRSISFKSQDFAYFHAKFPELAFRIGAYYDVTYLHDLLVSAGMLQLQFAPTARCLFIAGFPRCGTTSLGRALADAGIAVEPIISEPFTEVLGILEFEDALELFRNSFWAWPDNAPDMGSVQLRLDKSTHWLLAQKFVDNLFKDTPEGSLFLVAIRDPVQRSISAYLYNRVRSGSSMSLEEAIRVEGALMAKYGGYLAIFGDHRVYLQFINELSSSGIRVSILYSTLVMQNIDQLLPASQLANISCIDLDRGVVPESLLPDSVIEVFRNGSLPRANASPKDYSVGDQIDLLSNSLADLGLYS